MIQRHATDEERILWQPVAVRLQTFISCQTGMYELESVFHMGNTAAEWWKRSSTI